MSKLPLYEKYRPKTINDLVLHENTVDKIIDWCNAWINKTPNPEKPAILFLGPPGTGKTTAARCFANDCGWAILELNTSDIRTHAELKGIRYSRPLKGQYTCYIFDECDSLDKGGELDIRTFIAKAVNPVILTANNGNEVPASIKKQCEIVYFNGPTAKSLESYLLKIIQKENLNIPMTLLKDAAACGDFRLSLNILENKMNYTKLRGETPFYEVASNIFKGVPVTNKELTRGVLYKLESQAPKFYRKLDLMEAYTIMSQTDISMRRRLNKHAAGIIYLIPRVPCDIVDNENLQGKKKFKS